MANSGGRNTSKLCLLLLTWTACLSDTKVKAEQPALCSLPSETGPCRAAIPRFFYNTATKRCERFTYGGCRGNANNFQRETQCQAACSRLSSPLSSSPAFCSLPSETGPCRAAFRRFFYNTTTKRCERFTYGGCRGNDNNFQTETQCQAACTCSLPVDSGRLRRTNRQCRLAFQSYYDSSRSKCRKFLYGGCSGNGNRFSSNRQCNSICAAARCYRPRQVRRCSRSQSQRFFYNTTTKQCESFTYSGCNLNNENQFTSKRACERFCLQ